MTGKHAFFFTERQGRLREPAPWFPLDLSDGEQQAVGEYREQLHGDVPLDGTSSVTARYIARAMSEHIEDIVESDSLPHLGHVFNGWGAGKLAGRPLIERLATFVQRDGAGRPCILQKDPEGEFHPWQSFAYLLMAGVSPRHAFGPQGYRLEELARHSTNLNVDVGTELGHLLFALAHMDADAFGPFRMKDRVLGLGELAELAVEAHHDGPFNVCRKVHLTEGLCAAAARIPALRGHAAQAEGFLQGQMEVAVVFAALASRTDALIAAGKDACADSLVQDLRGALALTPLFDNHVNLAGHLLELGSLAAIMGYRLEAAQLNALRVLANSLNRSVPYCLPDGYFADGALHYGHFRRGLTLVKFLEHAPGGVRVSGALDLAEYTVDFPYHDDVPAFPAERARSAHRAAYRVHSNPRRPRDYFEQVLREYARIAPEGFEPRGRFEHFRRMGPPSWPRALHFELLDEHGAVSTEVHLESDSLRPVSAALQRLAHALAGEFPAGQLTFDPAWSRGRGRLRLAFPEGTRPEEVARQTRRLIEAASDELSGLTSSLGTTP